MIKKVLSAGLRRLLVGRTEVREFSTVGIGDKVGEKVYLRAGEMVIDVTTNQWMLGLEPLTFGVWVEDASLRAAMDRSSGYTIYFRRSAPGRRGKGETAALGSEVVKGASRGEVERGALAVAELVYFDRIDDERGTLFLLQISSSHIHHVDGWRAKLIYRRFYRKPNLSFNKLKEVVTAYSYPRRVRVISFQDGTDYNYIFPMDLLGDIRQSGRYLLGMRHSNQVLKKIVDVKKIVVSEFPAGYKPVIYKLGRNHSASPPPLEDLPFGVLKTRKFGSFVPEWVESYKEVEVTQTLDLGSHMLLFGEWSEDVVLKPATPRLHHIHFFHFLQLRKRGEAYPLV